MTLPLVQHFSWKARKRLPSRRPDLGSQPGVLSLAQSQIPTQVDVHCFSADSLEEDADQLENYLQKPNHVLWIDVRGLSTEAPIRQVAQLASIPDFMLEDMVNVPQRSGIELDEDRLLIITRMLQIQQQNQQIIEQVSIYVYQNLIVTFQEDQQDVFSPIRQRLRDPDSHLRASSAGYFAYCLFDVIVDAYFPVLEQFTDRVQMLEELVLSHPTPELLKYLSAIRHEVIHIHRAVLPQSDLIRQLLREQPAILDQEVCRHLKDTQDHAVQAAEISEMLGDTTTALLNLYMSALANKTNEKMKMLTIMATIFIPLTFLVGVYGMNFSHMPELEWRWGYPLTWVIMILTATGLLGYFYQRGWLTEQDHELEKYLQQELAAQQTKNSENLKKLDL